MKEKPGQSRPIDKILPLELEVSPFKIRPQTIDLVNKALEKTFPEQFGTAIKQLSSEDIIVVKDDSLIKYVHEDMDKKTHSARMRIIKDVFGDNAPNVVYRSEKESSLINITVRDLPGNPIFILESEITDFINSNLPGEVKRAGLEVGIGRILIHEGIHHFVDKVWETPVTSEDPLFEMAFTVDNMSGKGSANTLKVVEDIKKFASENQPSVKVEGTRIGLVCNDSNNERKVIAESGYDLEESFVELVTDKVSGYLLKYAKTNFSPSIVSAFESMFKNKLESNDDYRIANLTPVVMKYLSAFKINRIEDALDPFTKSVIPLLHAKAGGKEYLP